MSKKIKIIVLTMISCLVFTITGFADSSKKSSDSVLLPEGVNESTGVDGYARGNYISSSYLNISNKGYGEIGIYASTLCHKPVKKIRMNVYLDRWDDKEQEWFQVDYYNFTYEYKEGDEDLTAVSESFSVLGLPTGCYYRLRGFHSVIPFEGGSESQGPVTDGILITNGPAV